MSFPKYEHYKDSGVEWLGEVPAHWRIVPLKWYSSCRSGDGITSADIEPSPDDDHYIPAIGGNGLMGYARAGNITRPVLAIGRVGALCGNVHEISPPAWISDNALQLQPGEDFSLKYLAEVLRSRNLNDIASKTAQPLITGTQVQDQKLPQPAIDEQEAIVRFLNRETTKLDILITEQRTLIDLLKEKRQAVISHAVTKGLDPRVPMKDSGVEWLGEVPAHWVRTPLKFTVHAIIDTEHKTVEFHDDGEYMVARTSNIKFGKLLIEDAKYTNEAGYMEWTRRGIPEAGDIILTREAPAGEACIVPESPAMCLGQRTVLLKISKSKLDSRYGLWSIYGGLASEFISDLAQGSTVSHFNMSDIGNIPILLPTLQEQGDIADFIDDRVSRLDALTAEAQTTIALLQERRSALISAAVTGKIDVRQHTTEAA